MSQLRGKAARNILRGDYVAIGSDNLFYPAVDQNQAPVGVALDNAEAGESCVVEIFSVSPFDGTNHDFVPIAKVEEPPLDEKLKERPIYFKSKKTAKATRQALRERRVKNKD